MPPKLWESWQTHPGEPSFYPKAHGSLDVAWRVLLSSLLPTSLGLSFLQSWPGEAGAAGRAPTFTGVDEGAQRRKGRARRPPGTVRGQVSAAGAKLASATAFRLRFSQAGLPPDRNHFTFRSLSAISASLPCSAPGSLSPRVSGRLSDTSRASLDASVSPHLPSCSWVSPRVFSASLTAQPPQLSLSGSWTISVLLKQRRASISGLGSVTESFLASPRTPGLGCLPACCPTDLSPSLYLALVQ